MGVRRIPLRLPRAAPVPLCPGSSSSISPRLASPSSPPLLLPSSPPPVPPNLSKNRGPGFAPTATQSGPGEASESVLNPSLGATRPQHRRLNHPIARKKISLGES